MDKYETNTFKKQRIEIGERLRQFRLNIKLTQDEIAETIGISKTFYGQVERGISSLSQYRLLLLSEKLDADIGFILTGKKYNHIVLDEQIISISEKRLDHAIFILKTLSEMP